MSIVRHRGAGTQAKKMLASLGLQYFSQSYGSLGTLLARVRNSIGTTPVGYETPLGQMTVPQDPKYSGHSTESSSSAESKAEPYVNNVATKFLETAFLTISDWVERIQWANPNADAFLFHQYIPSRLTDLVLTKKCMYVLARHN